MTTDKDEQFNKAFGPETSDTIKGDPGRGWTLPSKPSQPAPSNSEAEGKTPSGENTDKPKTKGK